MNTQFPFHIPENKEEFNDDSRVFPGGKVIRADLNHIIDFEDQNSMRTFKIVKRASLDCGCAVNLQDAYFCFNPECANVVCNKHSAGPCVSCGKPSFCSECI